MQVALDDKELD